MKRFVFGAIIGIVALSMQQTVIAGPFGLFGRSSCSSGNCGSYSSTQQIAPDQLSVNTQRSLEWDVAPERIARKQSVQTPKSNMLVRAYYKDVMNGKRISNEVRLASR